MEINLKDKYEIYYLALVGVKNMLKISDLERVYTEYELLKYKKIIESLMLENIKEWL